MKKSKDPEEAPATPQAEARDEETLRASVERLEVELAEASELATSRQKELEMRGEALDAQTGARQSAEKELARVRSQLEASTQEKLRPAAELSLVEAAREKAENIKARLKMEVSDLETTVVELKKQRNEARAEARSERGAKQASQAGLGLSVVAHLLR